MFVQFKFQTEPFDHQKEALELSFSKKNFALLMEQGTGKSKVILDTAANLYLQGEINLLFVVAPSGVDSSWIKNQIPDHFPACVRTCTHIHKSATAKTARESRKRKDFLKSDNFKILVMMPEALITKAGEEFAMEVLKYHRALFVIDESGKLLKNVKARRTKTIIKLGKLAKYRRILTGTPITKSPLDVYPQFDFLDNSILGFNNYYSFKNYFATEIPAQGGGRVFSKITGYKNLDKLVSLVKPYAFRVLKKDCLDLPEKIYKKYYYHLDEDQERIYIDLKKNDAAFPNVPVGELDLLNMILSNSDMIIANHALTKLLRLQQILSGYVPLDSGKTHCLFSRAEQNPRIIALNDALEDCEGKVIIWCRFVQEIKSLLELYGSEAVAYFGEMSDSQRAEALTNFRTLKNVRYFIANPSCAGYGLTITEAHTVVYYSNDFNLETRLQSEDRCHRIGQKNNVTYIDIVAENTVDEHIARILTAKMNYSTLLDNVNKGVKNVK